MSSSPTETADAGPHAPDGHLGVRGDDPRMAQAASGTRSRPTRRSPTSPPTRWMSRSRVRPPGSSRALLEQGRRWRSVPRSPRFETDRPRVLSPGRPPPELPGQTSGSPETATPAPPAGEADRSSFYSPSFGASRMSTGSTWSRSRAPGIGGRVRKRDLVAFIESGRPQPAKAERPLHIESPYSAGRAGRARGARAQRPTARRTASRCRRCARRSQATWSIAATRPRTARRSSRSTCTGSPRGGRS